MSVGDGGEDTNDMRLVATRQIGNRDVAGR